MKLTTRFQWFQSEAIRNHNIKYSTLFFCIFKSCIKTYDKILIRRYLRYSLISFLLISLTFSCSEDTNNHLTEPSIELSPPRKIKAKLDTIILLKNQIPPEFLGTWDVNKLKIKEAPKASYYSYMENFNTEHGLALGSLLCSFRDKDGLLWFGTSGNGVNRYDGQNFITYNSSNGLIHNLVRDIMQDSFGNIWFSTYGGLSKFNGRVFINYTTKNGLINNDVTKMIEVAPGYYWIASEGGINHFDGKNFKSFKIEVDNKNLAVLDFIIDHDKNLMVATPMGVYLLRVDEEFNIVETLPYFKKSPIMKEVILDIHQDKEGNVWLGSSNGVYFINHKSKVSDDLKVKHYSTKNGLVSNEINTITEDSNHNIWICTEQGLSRLSYHSIKETVPQFFNITTKEGLIHNNVKSIVEDNSGSLWISTLGGGISKYNGESVQSLTTKQGLNSDLILAIGADKLERLWLGDSEGGLSQMVDGHILDVTKNIKSKLGYIADVARDKNNDLWFATDHGIIKYNRNKLTRLTENHGILPNFIISHFGDGNGNQWFGSYEAGLNRIKEDSLFLYTTESGLVHNTVWSLIQDAENEIWMATRGGLSNYDGEFFTNFTQKQGLVEDKLSCVFEDSRGNLIIGSWGSGVSFVRKKNRKKLKEIDQVNYTSYFERFTTSEGLSNDVVYGVLEDSKGNIFIGSSLGITVLKGGISPSGPEISRLGIENFNQKTGYAIKDISNNHAMYMDQNDVLWAGTGEKLIRFDYSKVIRNTKPASVFIHNLRINNEKISWHLLDSYHQSITADIDSLSSVPSYKLDEIMVYGKKLNQSQRDSVIKKFKRITFDSVQNFYSLPYNLSLPYNKNKLSFDFVGVETNRPQLMQYQYKLEGYDNAWSPLTNQTSVTYGNVHEGSYVFNVKALNPDGVWSPITSFKFNIQPPWYRSVLAYIIYFICSILILFVIDKIQRIRLAEKEEKRMVARDLQNAKKVEKAYEKLRNTQSQLIQAEKMASLGQLTAGIAHEIQNPLNFVTNYSEVSMELLQEMAEEMVKGNTTEANELAELVSQNMKKIKEHGLRADSIVKNMLQHSRSNAGLKVSTNINALSSEFVNLAYHGFRSQNKSFHVKIITELDESLEKIEIVPQDLGRVILNIATNAIYACLEKYEKKEPSNYLAQVKLKTKDLGAQLEISIEDNGIGMSKKIIHKIFQPFFTTKPPGSGTGLGLSMSYDIVVKSIGGKLVVESVPMQGSTFRILIPK
ncbi:ATP-binding protein [Weeksellaceae bacterium KMM 9713]|uniref:histidine kinase n=1 Tax=Profundicola chukchiensis TaxID=2961959 RepID=A0A9X4RXC5_9FLAO|nr:two-component regulator propeller domain-containing protein [Profundicola chukchiensis]MDG4946124.1 ATP-binding protein [Profundicola chukchiensis]